MRKKSGRLRRLRDLWPTWQDLIQVEDELQTLGTEEVDEETLDSLVAQLEGIASACTACLLLPKTHDMSPASSRPVGGPRAELDHRAP